MNIPSHVSGRQTHQLWRANHGIELVTVAHQRLHGRSSAVAFEAAVGVLQAERHRARRAVPPSPITILKPRLPNATADYTGVLPPSTILPNSGDRFAIAGGDPGHVAVQKAVAL